jgi:dinuclear metal center YbgI/SA1388 family protein
MSTLLEITNHLRELLSIDTIADYPQALNGLQLENDGQVTCVAAAVDACEAVILKAIDCGADLLLVHHGIFWDSTPIRGGKYNKLKAAIENNLAIYSAHLPLDIHPIFGNNPLLAKSLGLKEPQPFLLHKGQAIGVVGNCDLSRSELRERLVSALGAKVHVCEGGPEFPKRVGVVTGSAGSEIAKVAAAGVDTLITGEGPHWSYTLAEELRVNLFYGGHYATETFGVKALAAHLSERFTLQWEFIDHPTGL